MANTKITALTEDTTPTVDDLVVIVDDPGGTPSNKKVRLDNLLKLAVTNVIVNVFTSNGTFNAPTGLKQCLIICVGAGGSGRTVTGIDEATGGGGGGGTCIKLVPASEIGSAQTVTVGLGVANAAGTNSSVGVITLSTGGSLSGNIVSTTAGALASGGAGGAGSNGNLNIVGAIGRKGIIYSGTAGMGGSGGSSAFGGGGAGGGTDAAGSDGGLYGGGGGGAHDQTGTDRAGGTGANGVVLILSWVGANT